MKKTLLGLLMITNVAFAKATYNVNCTDDTGVYSLNFSITDSSLPVGYENTQVPILKYVKNHYIDQSNYYLNEKNGIFFNNMTSFKLIKLNFPKETILATTGLVPSFDGYKRTTTLTPDSFIPFGQAKVKGPFHCDVVVQ